MLCKIYQFMYLAQHIPLQSVLQTFHLLDTGSFVGNNVHLIIYLIQVCFHANSTYAWRLILWSSLKVRFIYVAHVLYYLHSCWRQNCNIVREAWTGMNNRRATTDKMTPIKEGQRSLIPGIRNFCKLAYQDGTSGRTQLNRLWRSLHCWCSSLSGFPGSCFSDYCILL